MTTYFAFPCMETVSTAFFEKILNLQFPGDIKYGVSRSSLVYDARNALAKQAIAYGCDRIMWIDSDMIFEPDLALRLAEDMDEGRDFVSGLYFKRKNPIKPVIYKDIGYIYTDVKIPYAISYTDYPRDSIFEIKGCGLGGCMMSTKIVEEVSKQFGSPFDPQPGFGEDLSFCIRLEAMGIPMYCDSRVKMGHVAQTIVTEETFDTGLKL